MSDRINETNLSKCYQSPQGVNSRSKRRITGSSARRANLFRLSDLAKLIEGRHGKPCYDASWSRTYFFAALPHILASRGMYEDDVRTWAIEWIPAFWIVQGDEWISEQIGLCLEKKRRFPRTDRLSRMLKITEAEVEAYGLRALPAVTRPKGVRQIERAAKSAHRSKRRRAKVPGYTPREESVRALCREQGISPSTHYRRLKKAQETADMQVARVDDTVSNAHVGVDGTITNATLPSAVVIQFRTQHHRDTRYHFPTKEEQAATMAALRAGAEAAQLEYAACFA